MIHKENSMDKCCCVVKQICFFVLAMCFMLFSFNAMAHDLPEATPSLAKTKDDLMHFSIDYPAKALSIDCVQNEKFIALNSKLTTFLRQMFDTHPEFPVVHVVVHTTGKISDYNLVLTRVGYPLKSDYKKSSFWKTAPKDLLKRVEIIRDPENKRLLLAFKAQ